MFGLKVIGSSGTAGMNGEKDIGQETGTGYGSAEPGNHGAADGTGTGGITGKITGTFNRLPVTDKRFFIL